MKKIVACLMILVLAVDLNAGCGGGAGLFSRMRERRAARQDQAQANYSQANYSSYQYVPVQQIATFNQSGFATAGGCSGSQGGGGVQTSYYTQPTQVGYVQYHPVTTFQSPSYVVAASADPVAQLYNSLPVKADPFAPTNIRTAPVKRYRCTNGQCVEITANDKCACTGGDICTCGSNCPCSGIVVAAAPVDELIATLAVNDLVAASTPAPAPVQDASDELLAAIPVSPGTITLVRR